MSQGLTAFRIRPSSAFTVWVSRVVSVWDVLISSPSIVVAVIDSAYNFASAVVTAFVSPPDTVHSKTLDVVFSLGLTRTGVSMWNYLLNSESSLFIE